MYKKTKWFHWTNKGSHLTPINIENNIGYSIRHNMRIGFFYSYCFCVFVLLLELAGNYNKQTFVLLCPFYDRRAICSYISWASMFDIIFISMAYFHPSFHFQHKFNGAVMHYECKIQIVNSDTASIFYAHFKMIQWKKRKWEKITKSRINIFVQTSKWFNSVKKT